MTKFDEATLRTLSWDNLKAVAKENGVRVGQKREKITEELLQIGRPKMTQLAKLRGDKSAIKMEKIRRRTVGHVKTPPRPTSSRGVGTRRARASTSRRAPEPEPQPQSEAVEAPAPVATPSEGQVELKPEEELRPLEKARALYRLEKERAEREKRGKEEAAPAEAQAPSDTAAEEPAAVGSLYSEQARSPTPVPVLVPMGVHVPLEPFKPRRTPRLRREDMPDEWRVGLLSPDPSNPRPVFSPPTKPRDEPTKEKESGQPLAPASEGKEVKWAPVVEEQERADDVDTDTELAEEEEVFEMTSIDDIRVTLPEDEAPNHVDEGDKIVRGKKRKAEDDDEEEGNEEKTVTALEQSPKKRRRTGLRGWLSKVF